MRSARLAFHFYKSLRDVDVSCMALFTGDATPVWGANFSTVIGKRLEIHGEAAFQKGCHAMVHPAAGEPFTLYLEDPLIDSIKNSRRIAAQVLLGFQFTFPGDILWVSEYFHRDQGYTRKEWKRLVSYADTLNTRLTSPSGELAFANLLWTLDVFSPKGAMRDYLMNHVRLTVFRDIALRCTVLANLSDFSRVLVPEAELGMGNRFAFYVRIFIFQGSGKSEFGTFYQSYTLEGGMRLR